MDKTDDPVGLTPLVEGVACAYPFEAWDRADPWYGVGIVFGSWGEVFASKCVVDGACVVSVLVEGHDAFHDVCGPSTRVVTDPATRWLMFVTDRARARATERGRIAVGDALPYAREGLAYLVDFGNDTEKPRATRVVAAQRLPARYAQVESRLAFPALGAVDLAPYVPVDAPTVVSRRWGDRLVEQFRTATGALVWQVLVETRGAQWRWLQVQLDPDVAARVVAGSLTAAEAMAAPPDGHAVYVDRLDDDLVVAAYRVPCADVPAAHWPQTTDERLLGPVVAFPYDGATPERVYKSQDLEPWAYRMRAADGSPLLWFAVPHAAGRRWLVVRVTAAHAAEIARGACTLRDAVRDAADGVAYVVDAPADPPVATVARRVRAADVPEACLPVVGATMLTGVDPEVVRAAQEAADRLLRDAQPAYGFRVGHREPT